MVAGLQRGIKPWSWYVLIRSVKPRGMLQFVRLVIWNHFQLNLIYFFLRKWKYSSTSQHISCQLRTWWWFDLNRITSGEQLMDVMLNHMVWILTVPIKGTFVVIIHYSYYYLTFTPIGVWKCVCMREWEACVMVLEKLYFITTIDRKSMYIYQMDVWHVVTTLTVSLAKVKADWCSSGSSLWNLCPFLKPLIFVSLKRLNSAGDNKDLKL